MEMTTLNKDGFDNSIQIFPKLVVFDLDFTLWPFWVDLDVRPHFENEVKSIEDNTGAKLELYEDVIPILEFLKKHNCKIAAASRNTEIGGVKQLLKLMGLNKYFDYREFFSGPKITHFANLKKASGLEYEDMILFDDEMRNLVDVSPLGVTCILVEDGMKKSILNEGLKKFESKKASQLASKRRKASWPVTPVGRPLSRWFGF